MNITAGQILALLFLVPPIALLAFIFASDMSKTVYTCEKCGKRFRGKWYSFLVVGYYGEDKYLKCPHCGKRTLCVVSYDQKTNV
ncbi:MAG: hypothetical protein IJ571_09025 [Ruminococcus sp.]|nr:hypothetical protein [Ruminococcus sp.]